MNDNRQIVAIDGPAGAGKSTVARRVAKALDFAFLDTGAMYRAATWRAMRKGIDLDDAEAVAASTGEMDLEISTPDGVTRVTVDGEDVSEAIRTPEVTRLIYKIDQNPRVREQLVRLQQEFGARRPTVAEGRDMGTVVFPNTPCKVYLDASLEERTRRRAAEMRAKGVEVDEAQLALEIQERDEQSQRRATSPLRQAEDAIRIDTTAMTLEEVVAAIVDYARRVL